MRQLGSAGVQFGNGRYLGQADGAFVGVRQTDSLSWEGGRPATVWNHEAKERLGEPHLPVLWTRATANDWKTAVREDGVLAMLARWKQAADCSDAEKFDVMATEESRG